MYGDEVVGVVEYVVVVDELCYEFGVGMMEDFVCGVLLFDLVLVYDYDVVGEGYGFFLFVGDLDEVDVEFVL